VNPQQPSEPPHLLIGVTPGSFPAPVKKKRFDGLWTILETISRAAWLTHAFELSRPPRKKHETLFLFLFLRFALFFIFCFLFLTGFRGLDRTISTARPRSVKGLQTLRV
jgi:hypothetical protein